MFYILIKYTSTSSKTFWYEYEEEQEDGIKIPFTTNDLEVLKTKIDELDKQFGYENIRVIDDVTYKVSVDIEETEADIEEFTSEEIQNIFNTAYDKVYNNNGGE